jgi:hypothetical protein
MPDGKRKRRHSANAARRRWYAAYRAIRFCRRFGWSSPKLQSLACLREPRSPDGL